jgi:hypothetical protein
VSARVTAVGLAVVLAGVGGACGGAPDLTADGYARAADDICAGAVRRAQRIDIPAFEEPRAAARSIDRVIEVYRGALEELLDLDAPKPDRTRVERWLAALDQAVDEAELARDALRAGDRAAATEAATRATTLGTHSEGLARGYGIAECLAPDLVDEV